MRYSLFAIILFTMLTNCSERGTTATPETGALNPDHFEEVVPIQDAKPRKVVGEFRSVAGTMNHLSCACSKGGYVKDLRSGDEIAVCFDNLDGKVTCSSINVVGVMTTKTIKPESGSPCPAGPITFLLVDSYECR